MNLQQLGKQALSQSLRQARMVKVMTTSGLVRPYNPLTLAGMAKALYDRGLNFAGGMEALALKSPKDIAIIDELGEVTWKELDERANRLAHGLQDLGVEEGDSVAVLCRNHRYFVDTSTALAKLGADILYLNTAFSAKQLGEVCDREKPAAIVYDDEFTELVDKSGTDLKRVIAWHEGDVEGARDGRGAHREGLDRQAARAQAHHPPGDPHLRHHGHAEGRAPGRVRDRRRRRAALQDAVQGRWHAPTSPHRCSTPGAGPTSTWPCCSARRWC